MSQSPIAVPHVRREAKRFLGRALCAALFSVSAAPHAMAQALLPLPPTTVQPFEATESGRSPESGSQTNETQTASLPDRGLAGLIKRGLQDQKRIYSAPFHRHNLKWDALFLVATGALIAADRHVTGAIPGDKASVSQHVSDAGLYSTMATAGVLLIPGILKRNERAREASTLAFEALSNTLAVGAVTQLVAGRERPLEGDGHGHFWVNNRLSSSFPSMHSTLTWSMASVLAHEYSRPWVQLLAYGTATTVSVTRVTGLRHFPADVEAGGFFGYFIGQDVFRAHSQFFPAQHDQLAPSQHDQQVRSHLPKCEFRFPRAPTTTSPFACGSGAALDDPVRDWSLESSALTCHDDQRWRD